VLLLHAGDFCQGTSYFTEFHGMSEVQQLNTLGYDVITLGNHEFDNGIEALGELLSHLNAPVVVCNYDFSPFEAGKYIKPYVILERAGKKIGVVGVLCGLKDMVAGDIANRIPEFDMVPTVQKYVDEIRPQVDYVIALTHIGYTEHNPGDTTDPMLCAATRGIDLFVGGHSHTFLEKPDFVANLDGKKIPIVQVGWMGVRMGEAHVTF
jgi:5'-nucleotidase